MKKINWNNFSKLIEINNENFDNILFLHAFSGSFKNKIKLKNALKNYNFYGFDQPGHSDFFNCSDESEIDIKNYYELAVNFILDFDIKNIILIGHSMGGGLSLIACNDDRIKHRIKKVILETPFSLAAKYSEVTINKLIPDSIEQMREIANLLFFDPISFFKSELNFENFLRLEFKRLQNKKNLKKIISKSEINNFFKLIELSIIENKIPTLVILGQQDQIILCDPSIEVFKNNPAFKIFVIKNAKHLPIAEHFDETVEIIKKFLEKNDFI